MPHRALADEETPLLGENGKRRPTPLPWGQFSILMMLQLVEPLNVQVIAPFTPQLIRDLGVTHGHESRVGYAVGIMHTLFFLTEAVTVLHWSRLSDSIGRKPVILLGLLGLSVSMYCLGLSTTFWGLIFSRCLNGALNGNVGVLKSMTAEITDATNISAAYAYLPLAWSTGSTLGPIIGGFLAQPALRFPTLFGDNTFLKMYPYFLPCAVAATFSVLSLVITYLYLKETVPHATSISRLLGFGKTKTRDPFLPIDEEIVEKPPPLRAILTPQVLISATNYATLSLVEIAFRAIQPLFFSTPIHLGGLGLPPSTIGNILAIFGVLSGVFQACFFAQIHDRYGSKNVFMWGVASAIPAFASFPVINLLARWNGYSIAVWLVVGFQIVISLALSMAYSAIFIFIVAASPNRASLGATNGLSQVMVSITRAIGPAIATSMFSLSMEHGYLGGYLVYLILLALGTLALGVGSLLPRNILAK